MTLDSKIGTVPGIGETRAAAFAKAGVFTVRDLLAYYPRRFENRGETRRLFDIADGETASAVVRIDSAPKEGRGRSGKPYIRVSSSDDTGTLYMTFFNQPWVKKLLSPGRVFRVYGKISIGLYGRDSVNPVLEPYSPGMQGIFPVYPVSGTLTQNLIARTVRAVLPEADKLPDVLPEELRKQFMLAKKGEAVRKMHCPQSESDMTSAARTLAFEELTVFQLALRMMRSGRDDRVAHVMTQKDSGVRTFFQNLPFSLTGAQQRAVKDIFADMQRPVPMMRLVQGDVGSGKTVLAAAAAYLCAKNGFQSAVMAPTEILASQHYATFEKMLSPYGINVLLITGSMTAAQKKNARAAIAEGKADVIIGTNAVIQSGVEFKSLALAVTDEQHRFGVMQRSALVGKGADGKTPHTLVMSATPIPRTLSLILYGDLDISILDERPPGRQKVITKALSSGERAAVNSFLQSEKQKGHQIFVVCPLVEESELTEAESAKERFEELQNELPGFRCGLLHGRMKPKEKDAVMEQFRTGELDLLVSTTVVEVGVDVPNATVMVIENAERFGLSTLHQLRGRIGRGSERSYCILVYGGGGDKSRERLETMCRTDDGFEIARTDLRLRGPGDFFGERQSGELRFKVASIADMPLIEQTRAAVDAIMENGLLGRCDYTPLREAAEKLWQDNLSRNTLN